MIINILQFERYYQTQMEHKITFTSDRNNPVDPKLTNIKNGTQFYVVMIPIEESTEFAQETEEETKERFRKHMNALINRVAELTNSNPSVYRENFKQHLKELGIIKNSTVELDLPGYSKVIVMLKDKANELE